MAKASGSAAKPTWSGRHLVDATAPALDAGRAVVTDFATRISLASCGIWRHLPTSANGQPAVAGYLRDTTSEAHVAWAINVLTLRDDRIAEIAAFIDRAHFAVFGLPESLQ